MDSPLIDVERVGAVAVLTLNRPPANALSMGLLAELRSALDDLARDMPGALVVSGSPKMFAAGADVKEFGDQNALEKWPTLFARGSTRWRAFLASLSRPLRVTRSAADASLRSRATFGS